MEPLEREPLRVLPPKEQVSLAFTFGEQANWLSYNNVIYMPVDMTGEMSGSAPSPERTIWIPRTFNDILEMLNTQYRIAFSKKVHMEEFYFAVYQGCERQKGVVSSILLKRDGGLVRLDADGSLSEPDGSFVPNTLHVPLNEDVEDKKEMRGILLEWLGGSEEDTTSLLHHLATALAPHWTSIKYVLLLGDGRNGKSVLMEMLTKMLGAHNCSGVTRQDMAAKSPVLTELNGKLANVVMDGLAQYLKDSGTEKTLIAGETAHVRMLYKNALTPVQTNALFIEGLNKEPKSSDKSRALQSRLVRFQFPNIYEEDLAFKAKMLSDRYVGALLSLMVDHYVTQESRVALLAPTGNQLLLKQDHAFANSHALQYLDHLSQVGQDSLDQLIGMEIKELVGRFVSWRISGGDVQAWDEQNVRDLFQPHLEYTRRSVRDGSSVRKVPVVKAFKADTLAYLAAQREHMEEVDFDGGGVPAALVED
jgi:hypothetical protein